MKFLGNILWFVLGGLISGLAWILAGLIWCVTIVGIPVGLQCFKLSQLSFWPFGREVRYGDSTVSFIVNLLWIIISGIELALANFLIGCVLCVTIVGIPFGLQFFKIAKLALAPFGAEVVKT